MPGGELEQAGGADWRALVEAETMRTQQRLRALETDFEAIVASADSTSTDDEHDPEGSSTAFERAQVSALIDAARATLRDLDAVRCRLDDGTFGVCKRCGRPIGTARLQARPSATLCIDCASARS